MGILKTIFTWWDGPTIGTRLWTARNGEKVGTDAAGNAYYRKAAKGGARERRWVVYKGENEASRVPPPWHGWLHFTHDDIPEAGEALLHPWVKPHQPNLTGTAGAYVRPGTLTTGKARPKTLGDYEAWSPDGPDEVAAIEDRAA